METIANRNEIGRRQMLTAAGAGAAAMLGFSKFSNAQQGAAPTVRSDFEAHQIDYEAIEMAQPFDLPFNDGVKIRGYTAINQPNCQVIIEDFFPGDEFEWTFVHDEIQYCLSGSMELKVWSPPLFGEMKEVTIVPGTIYNYPIGTKKRVKVLGDEPFRHICFCPPSPNYPFPTADQAKGLS